MSEQHPGQTSFPIARPADIRRIPLSRLGRSWFAHAKADRVPVYDRDLCDILAAVEAIGGRERPAQLQRLGRPAVLAHVLVGAAITLFGGVLLLASMPAFSDLLPGSEEAHALLALLGIPVMMSGAVLLRRTEQLMQPTVIEATESDPRPRVLLLRSFLDDDAYIAESEQGLGIAAETRVKGFEVALAAELARLGPLIAIGRPGEALPHLGAARAYFHDDEWQAEIRRWMDQSRLVVVIVGHTPGVNWELHELHVRQHVGKVLYVFPPLANQWAGLATAERRKRLEKIRESLAETPLKDLLAALPVEQLIALHTRPDGGVMAMTSEQEDGFDYTLALKLAIYGLLHNRIPDQPSATPARLRLFNLAADVE